MENMAVNVAVYARDVAHVIGVVLENALLCPRCTQLFEERSAAWKPIAQKEFCAACHSVISQLLEEEVEGRLREALRAKGLPPEAIPRGHSN
jgi:hypothetical protein